MTGGTRVPLYFRTPPHFNIVLQLSALLRTPALQGGHCLAGLWTTFGMAKVPFPDEVLEAATTAEAPEAGEGRLEEAMVGYGGCIAGFSLWNLFLVLFWLNIQLKNV